MPANNNNGHTGSLTAATLTAAMEALNEVTNEAFPGNPGLDNISPLTPALPPTPQVSTVSAGTISDAYSVTISAPPALVIQTADGREINLEELETDLRKALKRIDQLEAQVHDLQLGNDDALTKID